MCGAPQHTVWTSNVVPKDNFRQDNIAGPHCIKARTGRVQGNHVIKAGLYGTGSPLLQETSNNSKKTLLSSQDSPASHLFYPAWRCSDFSQAE